MIHHLSIPVRDPRHTVDVFCELFGGGVVTPFGPYPDSWIAWSGDEHGTAVECYPVGTEMFTPDAATASGHPAHQQAQFRHDPRATGHTATHAAISVDLEADAVLAIAEREGWRALVLPRGGFDVIEFWIDNTVMIELLTPTMAADYLAVAPRRRQHAKSPTL
jgi:catechol 2,3-dioxygenase-like lactoylglutathione lyase family enzyme